MAPRLEDGVPAHLRRNIDAALSGRRSLRKPPPNKQPANLAIPVSTSELESDPRGHAGSSFYGDGSTVYGDEAMTLYSASFSPTAASAAAAAGGGRSLAQLIDAAPGAPSVYGAARSVGLSWAKRQERQWYREQVEARPDRVAAETERLLTAAIGPGGLDPGVWRKLPGRVEAIAERNVLRQEAAELCRLRLEEWNPQVVANSATAAVRSTLAALRTDASSRGGGGSTLGSPSAAGGGGGGGSAGGYRPGSAFAGGPPGSGQRGSYGSQDSGGGRSRAWSARSAGGGQRYMETDVDKNRIRRALGHMLAKHGPDASPPAASASPSGPGPGPGPDEGSDAASSSPRRKARSPSRSPSMSPRRPSPGPEARALASRASMRVRAVRTGAVEREAKWAGEAVALAARVSAYLEMQSPASERVARAAADMIRTNSGRLQARSSGRGGALRGRGGKGPSGLAGRLAEWATAGRQQVEEKHGLGVELPPEQAARASRLVGLYEDACRRHGLHVDPGVSSALAESFLQVQGWRGHSLELSALTLMTPESAAALAEVLPQCAHINALTLARCVMAPEALGTVLRALWSLPLRRLHTPNTDFPPATWPLLQRAFGRPTIWRTEACWWQSVRSLELAGNALSDQGLCSLIEVLVVMPRLHMLALRQCGLTDLSAPQLERLLGGCPALAELDLGHNSLGPKAVGALALALPRAPHLSKLSLAWNSVGGGIAQLAWTLVRLGSGHCGLRGLDVAGTDLVAADMFAMAAMLRSHPRTCVRHLNLSYNNLVGVAGQCLLRHVNRLMQLEDPDDAASTLSGGGGVRSRGGSHGRAVNLGAGLRAPTLTGGSGSDLPAAAGGPGGASVVAAAAGGGRPLVPILKMGGLAGGGGAADGGGGGGGGGGRRITINPHVQAQSPDGTVEGTSSSPTHARLTAMAQRHARDSTPNGGLASRSPTRPFSAAASSTAASVTATAVTALDEPMFVITTDCVVVPTLTVGAESRVNPDGSASAPPAGSDSEDDGRSPRRRDQRDRDRDRERERERARRSTVGDGGDTHIGASGGPASRLGPGRAGAAAAAPPAPPKPTSVLEAEAAVAAAGAQAFLPVNLDLSRDLPDRATASLLIEHEMEARRHGFRSCLYGLKWLGKVYKRDGEEVVPIDVMFTGWTHSLPHQGRMELVVQVLPPALCPWLVNRRLHFNAARMLAESELAAEKARAAPSAR
ncbi:hypothetical protein HYH03_016531 [Edaphochlamys debaryana]|uniref:Uncharacterized protein n=1 Tax=Edaphochlamys debaryana TaxID=47281 RepID=A0A835XKY9_9CHLO|nr:hypothetical protein HYH03_016531 [Edaphochlamys debaryana]|eukprot:KAG2484703.1 hypothetical protein HYH03_016531 [Edaphochlamys debaryana]